MRPSPTIFREEPKTTRPSLCVPKKVMSMQARRVLPEKKRNPKIIPFPPLGKIVHVEIIRKVAKYVLVCNVRCKSSSSTAPAAAAHHHGILMLVANQERITLLLPSTRISA
mmetsp:Transcript_42898/g.63646  ORF Transcript_42898/g.63646 Transcript_42898/m.63646 type:complete len:111 (-) Transcript_42898:253-585(-)